MSLMSDGAALRASLRSAAFGSAISYTRGSTLSAAIVARSAIVQREMMTGESILIVDGRDFVFAVADAVWIEDGSSFTPQVGDKIAYGGSTYEVANHGDVCYEPSDSSGVSIRVHTVEVAS